MRDQKFFRSSGSGGGGSRTPSSSHHLLLAQSQQLLRSYLSPSLYTEDRAADPHWAHYYPERRSGRYLREDVEDSRALHLAADRRSSHGASSSQSYPDYADSRVLARYADAAAHPSPTARGRRADIADCAAQARVHKYGDSPLHGSYLGALSRGAHERVVRRGGSYLAGATRVAYDEHDRLSNGLGAREGLDVLVLQRREEPGSYGRHFITPDLKGSRYFTNLEPDMYSNYREAKSRRTGAREMDMFPTYRADKSRRSGARDFRSVPYLIREIRQIEGDTEGYGKRRRRANAIDHHGRRGPSSRIQNKRDSDSKADKFANGVDDHLYTGSYLRDRDRHMIGPAGNSRQISSSEPLGTVERDYQSEDDSELGSLRADGSDPDAEDVNKVEEIDGPLAGMIFGCKSATFHECMRLQLFGLPGNSKNLVMRVAPGTKLFLFNFETKELSGIFEAVSHGGMRLEPDAFSNFGDFPAQVQVKCPEQCPNLPISRVKPIIQNNYFTIHKFRFDLNAAQVMGLVKLFRGAARALAWPLPPEETGNDDASVQLRSQVHSVRRIQQHRQAASQQTETHSVLPGTSADRVISTPIKRMSRRAARRAREARRKKRKLNNGTGLLRENSSPLCTVTGDEANVVRDASKSGAATTIENHGFMGGGVVEIGASGDVHQHKEAVEACVRKTSIEGIDFGGLCDGSNLSKAAKSPQRQTPPEDKDGKHAPFVDDHSNSETFGLAGTRTEQQGKALNVHEEDLKVCKDAIPSQSMVNASLPAVNDFKGMREVSKCADVTVNDRLESKTRDKITGNPGFKVAGELPFGECGDKGHNPGATNTFVNGGGKQGELLKGQQDSRDILIISEEHNPKDVACEMKPTDSNARSDFTTILEDIEAVQRCKMHADFKVENGKEVVTFATDTQACEMSRTIVAGLSLDEELLIVAAGKKDIPAASDKEMVMMITRDTVDLGLSTAGVEMVDITTSALPFVNFL